VARPRKTSNQTGGTATADAGIVTQQTRKRGRRASARRGQSQSIQAASGNTGLGGAPQWQAGDVLFRGGLPVYMHPGTRGRGGSI
jgi:hypothetical protein